VIYAYHPSALVEAIGALNAQEFDINLHNHAAIVGLLSSKGFVVRGDLESDLNYLSNTKKLPDQVSFFHPNIVDAFLNYIPEIDEVDFVEGQHPALAEEVVTYSTVDILTDWVNLSSDDLCLELLVELGEEEDELMDASLVVDLESCFPLTTDQRGQLAELVFKFMGEPTEYIQLSEPDEEYPDDDDQE